MRHREMIYAAISFCWVKLDVRPGEFAGSVFASETLADVNGQRSKIDGADRTVWTSPSRSLSRAYPRFHLFNHDNPVSSCPPARVRRHWRRPENDDGFNFISRVRL